MAKYPVVVYGACGYTGMLIMDWLIDQNIPFTAVARNAKRTQEMMAQRVVRLESATYEIIECEHDVDALAKAFKGAKVVCNTVGPFVNFGLTAVEAALKAGCHHLDTTGEQSYMRDVREQFGEAYRRGRPALRAVDRRTCTRWPRSPPNWRWRRPASTCSRPRRCVAARCRVRASPSARRRRSSNSFATRRILPVGEAAGRRIRSTSSYDVSAPEFLQPVFCLPWGGTSLPVFYQNDARVRSCRSLVGFYDNPVMRMVRSSARSGRASTRTCPRSSRTR